MKCPYLEVNEFNESICHCHFGVDEDNCPKEFVDNCSVSTDWNCKGFCEQCNNKFECENSVYEFLI